MKIGILTLPLHINYGGIMQAYALQTVLERMGHEVVVYQKDIHYSYKLPLWKYPYSYSKRLLKKFLVDNRLPLNVEKKRRLEEPIIRRHLNHFIDSHIHTVMIEKPKDIDLSAVDCIVVGSDQIWRPVHLMFLFKSYVQESFLDFAVGWKGKRVAYGASFGVDQWEYTLDETTRCRELAKLFDAISVREYSGVKLCEDYLGVKAEHVLDPTLLLHSSDYLKLIEEANTSKNTGELFCYILDKSPEKEAFVNRCALKLGMEPYTINLSHSDLFTPVENRIMPSIEQWLRSFYDAKFIITDSFHGCVFSILFNKPFVAIGNEERGMSRFVSLLSLLGLEDLLVSDLNDVDIFRFIENNVDYEKVLLKPRKKSLDFLNTFLK